MIDRGATTLWETWKESDNVYSQNHPMFGSVDAWIVKDLLGIRVADDAIGADKISIAPCATKDVEWAKGEYRTVKGVVGVAWEKAGDKRHLAVAIPEGVSVRVQPQLNGEWVEVKGGRHEWK
jgi:alpha-L-rhamnosidase